MNYNDIADVIRGEISSASMQYTQIVAPTLEPRKSVEDIMNEIALEIQRKGGQ